MGDENTIQQDKVEQPKATENKPSQATVDDDNKFRRHFEVPGEPEQWKGMDHGANIRAIVSEAINFGVRMLKEPRFVGAERIDRGFGHVSTLLKYEGTVISAGDVEESRADKVTNPGEMDNPNGSLPA